MDANRLREQEELRSALTLLDQLETDEALARRRHRIAIAVIAVAVLLAIVLMVKLTSSPMFSVSENKLRECELDALNARSNDFIGQVRRENPGMPYGDIARKLDLEQPSLKAGAHEECQAKVGKASK